MLFPYGCSIWQSTQLVSWAVVEKAEDSKGTILAALNKVTMAEYLTGYFYGICPTFLCMWCRKTKRNKKQTHTVTLTDTEIDSPRERERERWVLWLLTQSTRRTNSDTILSMTVSTVWTLFDCCYICEKNTDMTFLWLLLVLQLWEEQTIIAVCQWSRPQTDISLTTVTSVRSQKQTIVPACRWRHPQQSQPWQAAWHVGVSSVCWPCPPATWHQWLWFLLLHSLRSHPPWTRFCWRPPPTRWG